MCCGPSCFLHGFPQGQSQVQTQNTQFLVAGAALRCRLPTHHLWGDYQTASFQQEGLGAGNAQCASQAALRDQGDVAYSRGFMSLGCSNHRLGGLQTTGTDLSQVWRWKSKTKTAADSVSGEVLLLSFCVFTWLKG